MILFPFCKSCPNSVIRIVRSLPAVAGNPRFSALAIRARVLSGSLNHMRVKSAPSVVQIFRQNEPNAQNQFCSHSVNSVRGSAPVSPHRLGRLSQSPLPEKPAGRFCLWRYERVLRVPISVGERLSLSTKRRSLFIQIDPCADGIREIIFPGGFCDGQRLFACLYGLFKSSRICISSGERVEQSALFAA